MELMCKATLAKCDTPSSSTAHIATPEPTASEAPDEPSETTSKYLEGTTIEHEERESLDESLNVPVTTQLLSDHDSSDSCDDGSSFTGDNAHQVYQECLEL